MKRGRTIPMIDAAEVDAFSRGWVRLLCVFHNNTGIRKWAKRKYNKRVRKDAKRNAERYVP